MGGRGASSGLNIGQISIKQYGKFQEIQKIKEKGEQIRDSGKINTEGGFVSPTIYKRCHCCRDFTLSISTTYETCHLCGWIDDEYQNTHPDSLQGMNAISLNEAREKYLK